MDESIYEILKEKYANVVQFNFTNSTSNPINVDLFNSASLSPIPTSVGNTNPTYSTNRLLSTIFPTTFIQAYNSINNSIYLLDLINQNIIVYDISSQFSTFIALPTVSCFDLLFCPTNNNIYVTDDNVGNPIVIIDCSLNVVSGTIAIGAIESLSFMEYNPNNNFIYIGGQIGGTNNSIYFLDCSTNILTASLLLPFVSSAINFSNVTSSNFIYFTYGTNIRKIDCSTNTITGVSITVSAFTNNNMIFNPNNDLLYGTINGSSAIFVINTNTDTFLFNLTSTSSIGFNSNNLELNNTTNQLFVASNITNDYDVFDCNLNSYIKTNQVSTTGHVVNMLFIQSTETLYTTDTNTFLTEISTAFSVTPFYVIGSANYNSFVNNLNNEPIFIQIIRLLVQNQEQLFNQLQFTKIDANGNQLFFPELPITKIDTDQEQGNIASIDMKNLVFDGRTYINQYQLNGFESVSFEIYYKQLDLTSVKPNLPMFFKPKVQLKEYIKKELNL
jgi:hypothetical protein